VIGKISVTAEMHGPFVEGFQTVTGYRYTGIELEDTKKNLYVFPYQTQEHLKMTAAELGAMVDQDDVFTGAHRDRYILHGNGEEPLDLRQLSDIWDGIGYRTYKIGDGNGYKIQNIEIKVDKRLFTSATTTTATTATATTTTNTIIAQMNKDLDGLKEREGTAVKTLVDSVETVEAQLVDEILARKTAEARIVQLEAQVAGLLPLADRLAALEARMQAHTTLPAAVRDAVQDMQPAGSDPVGCTGSSGGICAPEVSATDSADLALTAKSGKVLLQTDECGTTDICKLVTALQGVIGKFD